MALIGPSPTVSGVLSLVRQKNGDEADEVLSEVVQFTDGPILTHLAANGITRAKVHDFVAPRLDEVFPEMQNTSDPQFVALSWLADEFDDIRAPVLALVAPTLSPESPAALTVLTRLLAKGKLDKDGISKDTLEAALQICNSESTHWRVLATVFVKDVAPAHAHTVEQFVADRIDADDEAARAQASAVIEAAGDTLPSLVDAVWKVPADQPSPSNGFLRLLSGLCNKKDTRDRVSQRFGALVARAADDKNEWAAVVDAKLMAGVTSQTGDVDAAAKRLDFLSSSVFESSVNAVTLEGLVCSAALPSVRARAGANKALVSGLCTLVHEREMAYGALAVLLMLAKYPMKPSQTEKQQTQLRIEALGKSPADVQEPLEDRAPSGRVCDHVVASGLVRWLSENVVQLSQKSRDEVALLLRELACHQDNNRRQNLATQGAVVIALYLWLGEKQALDPHMKTVAVATVSKILASVVPQLALTIKVSKTAVIEPLVDQIANRHSDRMNLDTFEALRALTNLSSANDRRLRTAIAQKAWSRMWTALDTEFVPVQRSAVELMCNLMTVPISAEHFIQRNGNSSALLSLIGQSVVSDDRDTRIAAAGAIAILAEWETAPEAIGHNKDCIAGISRAIGMFSDDNDMLIRVLTALITLIKGTAKHNDDEVVESVIHYGALANLETLVDTIDPVKHMEASRKVLKCIQLLARYKMRKKMRNVYGD